ncbi:MAG: DUF296 domain-containing protein [Proteobacteria bacterium]|nr:DUF296 domain-containing protein [Pseudomonadota bacterium]
MKHDVRPVRQVLGRLAFGDDLLVALTRICEDEGIMLGRVSAIGALSEARIGFYDQAAAEYIYHDLAMQLELIDLVGNVSEKEGRPFVHAHVTLGRRDGGVVGGHLFEGSMVFACEYVIEVLESEGRFTRRFDPQTGLFLWAGE